MISDDMVKAAAAAKIRMPGEAEGETIAAYLRAMLADLWRKGDQFSAKRPFGYSGWQVDVYKALVRAALVSGVIDADGYLDAVDERAADELVQAVVARGLGPVDIPAPVA